MKKRMSRIIGFVLLAFFACEEDEPVDPQIRTEDVVTTSASSFMAKGTISTVGSYPVLDYGFVYSSYSGADVFSGNKVSLGTKPEVGSYQSDIIISGDGWYNLYEPYYVRAYLTNEKGTVYGVSKSFSFPQLSISSVSPQQGKAGDLITVNGANFSTNPGGNIVKFNQTLALVKSASSTQLTVEVPQGISSSYYYDHNVTISVSTGPQRAERPFTLLPDISDFSPKTGTFGTVVTISGNNLYGYSYSVYVGDISASINSVTTNSITFSIPYNVTSERFKIKVGVGYSGYVIELPGEFEITKPVITSISPTTSVMGSLITISGSGFNTGNYYYTNYNRVWIGAQEASISTSSTTEVKVYVPTGLTPGDSYDVKLSTGVHTVTAPQKFTLATPVIEDFLPKTTTQGNYITITGSNFGNVQGTVLIGGVACNIYNWTDKSIQVQIPSSYYLTDGAYQITVNAGGQSAVSEDEVTIE